MASAMGVARMPTHGSWRPSVSTTTGRPCLSMDRRGIANARSRFNRDSHHDILTGRNTAENSAGMIGDESFRGQFIAMLRSALSDRGESGPNLHAFDRIDAHHGRRQIGIQLVIHGTAPTYRHMLRDGGDLRADGISRLPQLIHKGFEFRHRRRIGREKWIRHDRIPTLKRDIHGSELARDSRESRRHTCAWSHFLAMAAAATRTAVSRADERPPPR